MHWTTGRAVSSGWEPAPGEPRPMSVVTADSTVSSLGLDRQLTMRGTPPACRMYSLLALSAHRLQRPPGEEQADSEASTLGLLRPLLPESHWISSPFQVPDRPACHGPAFWRWALNLLPLGSASSMLSWELPGGPGLGLQAFPAEGLVQSLAGELRAHKMCGMTTIHICTHTHICTHIHTYAHVCKVTVSQGYTYIKTYQVAPQVAPFTYVKFISCQLYYNKTVKKAKYKPSQSYHPDI